MEDSGCGDLTQEQRFPARSLCPRLVLVLAAPLP
jgi:hypothetical protein